MSLWRNSAIFLSKTQFLTLVTTKPSTSLTDSELISEYLRSQNTHYFTLLYRRYAGKVFAKCISLLRDDGLARDATQDIFIKIMLNLGKFSEQSSFSTWIYSITYNFCIDIIRKKKKIQLVFTEDMAKISKETNVEIPDSVILEMKHDRMSAVLDKLPIGDKAILMMKYHDDLQIKTIAE